MSNIIFNKNLQHLKKKITKIYKNFVTTIKIMKIKLDDKYCRFIKDKQVKAMISFEVICIIGVLVFIVNKIVILAYAWIQKFYLMYGVLLVVSSYIQIPNAVETEISNVHLTTNKKEKTLVISCENPETLRNLMNFLQNKLLEHQKYKMNLHEKILEITIIDDV